MALTKVTGSVIKDSVSLSGNVSVGGTLTYQDVTNVDALGIGTFRTGIKVLAGQVDVGSNIKIGNAGVITATSFVGNIGGTPTFSGDITIPDKIVHAGDTNTAIRFPSADTVTIETGGAQRFRVDSNGTTHTTQVNSVIGAIIKNTAHDSQLQILATYANKNSVIFFGDAADDDVGKIDYDHNDNSLAFVVNTSEALRITSAGNIGVNVSSPDRKLHVGGSFIRVDDGYGLDTSGSTEKVVLDNGFIALTTNSNERLRIQSDGDVSFSDSATGAAQIKSVSGDQADRNNGGYPQYAFVGNEGTGMRRPSSNVLAFDSTGAERFRIDSSGRFLKGLTGTGASRSGTSVRNPHFQLSSPWSSGLGSYKIECTDDYPIIFIDSNASYADGTGAGVITWSVKDSSGDYCNTASVRSKINGTPSNDSAPGSLEFMTTTSGSTPTTKMTISSQGYVTNPTRPYFKANKSGRITGTGVVVWDTVVYNNGSCYNNSNGRFTAPIAGLYWFSAKINAYDRCDFWLQKNGTRFERGQYNTDSGNVGWWSNQLTSIVEMTAGQYVEVNVTQLDQQSDPGEWLTFMGYLLS